jgi:hypothetical protein
MAKSSHLSAVGLLGAPVVLEGALLVLRAPCAPCVDALEIRFGFDHVVLRRSEIQAEGLTINRPFDENAGVRRCIREVVPEGEPPSGGTRIPAGIGGSFGGPGKL